MALRPVRHAISELLVCALLSSCTLLTIAQSPLAAEDECVTESSCSESPDSDASSFRTFYDDASTVAHVFSQSNVMVATDNPDGFFWKDGGRFIQSDKSIPGSITYRFNEGGMDRVRVSVAIRSVSTQVRDAVNITITPYIDQACAPEPTPTNLSDKDFSLMKNGMEHVEMEYDVGGLPQLNCNFAKAVQIDFLASEGSEVQILSVKLIGVGEIAGLRELAHPDENPQPKSGILENSLVIYILIGVGAVFLLVMLALVWVCCGRPCCCGPKDAAGEQDQFPTTDAGVQLPAQVVIPVDCVVPDMPVSMDEDSGHIHAMAQKYASATAHGVSNGTNTVQYMHSMHPSHAQTLGMQTASGGGRTNSISTNCNHPQHVQTASEPVVDLSVPTPHAQPDFMGVGLAPRHGQDIFDTWHEGGMSAYQSGEEYDASGPLDTRERSFTGNPPVSSTGNTSPTQESSVLGVTAQLGMRLKELKNLQGEHERVAKGQADSNGDFATTPEPLGVKYGRKIGVGGFGAVYVGEWAGKTVAIKVIKMPHSHGKQSEDKEKMAFMEYAISGILLHNNIVQTHQADIRPVFLDDDTETGTVSKSGWTGLGEFLSNEAISQKMAKSMRIQEWELRLIMEYCNKGNLKEAIRQKSLMADGSVKALEVALLALDIAKACQAIHKHNIIHGDLKPHNVLLTVDPGDERGWLGKIADFGLSVKIKRGEKHVSGIQHGTEGYVAPEVLQTRRMVKASDVYSFGIIMWELWHARLYYEEYRHAQRRMRRVTLDFRPTFERGCPEEWINLAKSCWALRPEERPDFDRVVKMMRMIIATIRDKINTEGVISGTN